MMEFPKQSQFEGWLAELPDDRVIAENWTAIDCPIGAYLKWLGRSRIVLDGAGGWATSSESGRLPDWAREFIWRIDLSVDRIATAGQCLRVLRSPYFDPGAWQNGRSRPVIGKGVIVSLA